MRIHNFLLPQLAVGPSDGKAEVSARSDAADTTSGQPPSHSLSAELLGLIQLANQQPEVRSDVVQQAQQNLAQGVYSTSASAEQTAAAILQNGDG